MGSRTPLPTSKPLKIFFEVLLKCANDFLDFSSSSQWGDSYPEGIIHYNVGVGKAFCYPIRYPICLKIGLFCNVASKQESCCYLFLSKKPKEFCPLCGEALSEC